MIVDPDRVRSHFAKTGTAADVVGQLTAGDTHCRNDVKGLVPNSANTRSAMAAIVANFHPENPHSNLGFCNGWRLRSRTPGAASVFVDEFETRVF